MAISVARFKPPSFKVSNYPGSVVSIRAAGATDILIHTLTKSRIRQESGRVAPYSVDRKKTDSEVIIATTGFQIRERSFLSYLFMRFEFGEGNAAEDQDW